MIFVVDAANRSHFATDLAVMHRQRKAVFVDRAGWKLPVFADQEMDSYDLREDTMYLLAKVGQNGPLLASTRLLTTTGPHLMADLFDTTARENIPRGPTVWEASRFCTAPHIRCRRERHELLWEVISGVIETALLYAIDEVIFAANRSLLPLALGCGWDARSLGPRFRDEGGEITAVAAAITTAGLRRVRELHRTPIPITQFLGKDAHVSSGHGENVGPRGARPAVADDTSRLSGLLDRNCFQVVE